MQDDDWEPEQSPQQLDVLERIALQHQQNLQHLGAHGWVRLEWAIT